MPDDRDEHEVIGSRLREARELIGLLQDEAAAALGIPRTSLSALEAGKRKVSGVELRRLARLYRRPVGWLIGEEEIQLSNADPLFRATSQLSDEDKEQVLRFAEFLAAAGRPGTNARAAGRSAPRKRDRKT